MPATILVIEDNPASLDLMTYLLGAFGHRPLCARDAAEGLETAHRELPDLILCDLELPAVDGCEIARRLRADPDFRQVPLVAVTAYAMAADRERALAAGFDGYIAKPIDPQRFVAQVESFLGSHHDPRPPSAVDGPAATAPHHPPAAGATVLVVEDSAANVSLVRSLLEPNGYRLVHAGTVARALEMARADPPDLILCDVHLPDRDGFALIEAVKAEARLRPIPFVFISSTLWREQDRRYGLDLGATKFILRPVEAADLLAELQEALGR